MTAAAVPAPLPSREVVATRIAAERRATLLRLEALQSEFSDITAASVNSNADDEHDPEGSTIAFERSQVDALRQDARRHLDELEAAAARLADDSYGGCEVCGEQISPERLEARPVARLCMPCTAREGSRRS